MLLKWCQNAIDTTENKTAFVCLLFILELDVDQQGGIG